MFLAIALSGQADFIVSRDNDLLVLSPFEGIPIIPPALFLAELEKKDRS
jgi:predicted nucleic acid-binding protein